MNSRRSSSSRKSRSRAKAAPRRAAVDLTPEQMAARWRAEHEDQERRMCDLNLFWMDCTNGACRRVRRCAGDPFACFRRRWDALPETERQWRRDWLEELYRTKDVERAVAFARARAAERERLAAKSA